VPEARIWATSHGWEMVLVIEFSGFPSLYVWIPAKIWAIVVIAIARMVIFARFFIFYDPLLLFS
jgi:hypothetical protein